MTALEALNLSEPLSVTYMGIEHDLLVAISKQLGSGMEINSATEWRIRQLSQTGNMSKQYLDIIAKSVNVVPEQFYEMLEASITNTLDWLEPDEELRNQLFQKIINGKTVSPVSGNMSQAWKSFETQAKDKLNQVNTVMQYKADSSFVNAVNSVYEKWTKAERIEQSELANKQNYLSVLNKNTAHVVSGTMAHKQAVTETVLDFAERGIPAFIDKKGREWSPEAYISMDIRTTAANVARQTVFTYMDEQDLDLIEVSYHANARPLCMPYQGRIFSRSNKSGVVQDIDGNDVVYEPLSSTSYGEAAGLFGIHCGHQGYPVRAGLFKQTFAPPADERAEAKAYKTRVQERSLEREVKANATKADCLSAAGDIEGAKLYADKVKLAQMDLNSFRSKMVDKSGQRGIIESDINVGRSLSSAAFRDTVRLPDGRMTKLTEGTKITKVVTFAGKGTSKEVKVAKHLEEQYNVPASEWRKVRGDGYVDVDNASVHSELHWFESEKTGRIKMKVKRYFNDKG